MNYFEPKSAADRYSKGRPHFHSNTIQHIKAYLNPEKRFENALDIACGTGLSTTVLSELATRVFGTDTSPEMLKHAKKGNNVHFAVAPAERQPFSDNTFDLVTVSSGVHWFDIDKFLIEVNRILKSKAWLVLYENHFIADMEGDKTFTSWFYDVYLNKFPSPPRNNDYSWANENLNSKNFNFIFEEKFTNPVTLNKEKLALYFTTQSNIIAAVENHLTTYEEVDAWLNNELECFFDPDHRVINFGNWIKYIQRAS
jgi:ubiquinone/menaquinone biosynthesis C-methylase UbiE